MKKKLVNSVLSTALVASAFSFAAVAGAEEKQDAANAPELDVSVKRLQALGLAKGDANGNLNLDKPLTRAEFATLITRIRGLESGVEAAKFSNYFTDVKPGDWYAGYVNIATGEEIIKGYGNGKFGPNDKLTYAQAITMMVRALGYEPAVKGGYPNGFISKAAELDITEGITFNAFNEIPRKDIFKMIDNSLDIDLMEQVNYGTETRFEIKDGKEAGEERETLLSKYLDVALFDEDWSNDEKDRTLPVVKGIPIANVGDLKPNELRVDIEGYGTRTYEVASWINPNAWSGENVQLWVKDVDGANPLIVNIEPDPDEKVVRDIIDEFYYKGVETSKLKVEDLKKDFEDDKAEFFSNLEVKLANGDTYDFAASKDVVFAVDLRGVNSSDLADFLKTYDDQNVKIVLNDNDEIRYISVVNYFDNNTQNYSDSSSLVVEKVDADDKLIKAYGGDNDIDLSDTDYMIYRDGKPAKLEDIQPGDLVYAFPNDDNDENYYIEVLSTKVKVTVDKVTYTSSKAKDHTIVAGDKKYKLVTDTTYSDDNNDTVDKAADKIEDIRDLEGAEVELYLDKNGKVRHIVTGENVKGNNDVAVVIEPAKLGGFGNDQAKVTLLTEEGKELDVTFDVDDTDEIFDEQYKDLKKAGESDAQFLQRVLAIDEGQPVVVKYKLDKDGDLDEIEIVYSEGADLTDDEALAEALSKGDFWVESGAGVEFDDDDDAISTKKGDYDVTDETVIFDLTQWDATNKEFDDPELGSWDSLEDEDDAEFRAIVDEDGDVKYVIVTKLKDGGSLASGADYAVVDSFGKSGNDDTVFLLLPNGEKKEYVVDGSINFGRRDFIRYELNGDGEVDDVEVIFSWADKAVPEDLDTKAADLDSKPVAIKVADENSSSIKGFDGANTKNYLISDKTIYFDLDARTLKNGVEEEDYVVVVETDDDGSKIDYVLWVSDQDEAEEDGLTEKGEDWTDFLKGSPDKPGEGPEFKNFEMKEKPLFAGLYAGTVSGTIEGEFDPKKISATVAGKAVSDSKIKVEGKQVTIEIAGKEGDKVEVKYDGKVKFEDTIGE